VWEVGLHPADGVAPEVHGLTLEVRVEHDVQGPRVCELRRRRRRRPMGPARAFMLCVTLCCVMEGGGSSRREKSHRQAPCQRGHEGDERPWAPLPPPPGW